MAEAQPIGSILLADCGTVMTKAVLIEQVGGRYRFVAHGTAPTAAESPWSDVASSIQHAVERISRIAGRDFFNESGRLISPEVSGRKGVDVFAATTSASRPLEVVIAGLVRDLSVASAERAAGGTYSLVKAVLASDGPGGRLSDEDRARVIRDAAPDVVCVAGGTEGGAGNPVLELVETATIACSLMKPETRPLLLYMGNSRLRRHVVDIVDDSAELRVTDNVRPTPAEENLLAAQEELDALYKRDKMSQLPGVQAVDGWSQVPLTSTAAAFSRLMQYLWHLGGDHSRGVIGVDVGAASTTLAAVFDGHPSLTVQSDLGSAFGGQRLLQERDTHPEPIVRWLPEAMSAGEVRAQLINKESHPVSIGQEPRQLWVEQAMAREAIQAARRVAQPGWRPGAAHAYSRLTPLCDTIVVRGGVLAHAPRPGQAALIVLDGLEPIGVSTLVLDRYGLAPALGNLAAVKPLAAVEALDNGGLVNLATVVAPVGQARPGDLVLKARVTYEDDSKFTIEVRYGDLEVLPLMPGQQAVIELRPLRHFDVGLGGPGKGGKRLVNGGLAGLIIDARGRPLCLADTAKERQLRMQQWIWDVGG